MCVCVSFWDISCNLKIKSCKRIKISAQYSSCLYTPTPRFFCWPMYVIKINSKTMGESSWEAITFWARWEVSHLFLRPKVLYHVHRSLIQIGPGIPTPWLFKIHVISFHLCLGFPSSPFFWLKLCMNFSSLSSMLHVSLVPSFINIWCGVQSMKFVTFSFL